MDLTKTEKLMKLTALAYALIFIGTALIFFLLLPGVLFKYINIISQKLFPALPLAADTGKFWLSMTLSMMAGVTVTSLLIYKDVKKYYTMAIPLVAMKFASSLCGLGFFIAGTIAPETAWNTLANLVICITDFPLGLLMLYFYRNMKKELG
ncbi:MAG: hypothetical protein GY754_02755 [bacterium]|nr:hypothetical protein [bacterium]